MSSTRALVKHIDAIDRTIDIDQLCSHIINGGSMANFCSERNIQYSDLIQWVNMAKDRKEALRNAKQESHHRMDDIIRHMATMMVSFDPKEIFLPDGSLKQVSDWPESARACMAGFDVSARGDVKVKFTDRLKAMELMARPTGTFQVKEKEKNEGTTLAELVLASYRSGDTDSTP